jgi:hypothetical protein
MWNGNMTEIAKARQADFWREAERNRMARMASGNQPSAGRAGETIRRIVEHAGQWITVRGFARPVAGTAPQREQLAC